MPILINNDTGLAEQLAPQQVEAATTEGTHSYPMIDPEGNAVAVPRDNYHESLASGHTLPTPEQLQKLQDYAKYSSTTEQAKTFAENAAKDATFGLSTGLETAAGVDPKAIKKRSEVNPGVATLGSLTGLVGSSLIPIAGEANVMAKAGKAAETAMGLAGAETMLGKATAAAVKQATEMALMQGGDEVSKAFISDPDQSAQTAIANIGLSGLMGGAIGGAANPLWHAVSGSKLADFLTMTKEKVNGVEASNIATDMAAKAGIDLPAEMQAMMSGESRAKTYAQELAESGTKAGGKMVDSIEKFRKDASNSIITALGKTPEDVDALANHSKYEAGKEMGDTLAQEFSKNLDPISSEFDELKNKYKDVTLTPDTTKEDLMSFPSKVESIPGTINKVGEKIGQLSLKEGWSTATSSDISKTINKIMRDLPRLKTLGDLGKFATQVNDIGAADPLNGPLRRAMGMVKNILRDAESDAAIEHLGSEAPELVERYKAARDGYNVVSSLKDQLADRLGIRGSAGSFAKGLKEMASTDAESLLRRLTTGNDADLLDLLGKHFPETAQLVKKYHVDNLLKTASAKTTEGINTKTFYNALAKMSPEVKQFALGDTTALDNVKALLDKLPQRLNPSGTGRALDSMWRGIPGGVGAMVGMVMGGHPVIGGMLGKASQLLGREVPDAGKLAYLKFMGSSAPVNPGAYKAMYDMTASLYKATSAINRASANVIKGASEVLPAHSVSDVKVEKLDKLLKAAQTNPASQLNNTGDLGHYMPDHAAALGAVTARATNYLNSLRPDTSKPGILNKDRVPSKIEEGRFQRALRIAEDPKQIFQHIANGALTPEDMRTMTTIYPGLTRQFQQALTNELIKASEKEEPIPAKAVGSLSLFLGQPLRASMQPMNMLLNAQAMVPQQPPQQAQSAKPPSGAKLNGMAKHVGQNATPQQAREQSRLKG